MKVLLRAILSTTGIMLIIFLTDYYLDGVLKYLLTGIGGAVILLYNEKKNRELKATKDSKDSTNIRN